MRSLQPKTVMSYGKTPLTAGTNNGNQQPVLLYVRRVQRLSLGGSTFQVGNGNGKAEHLMTDGDIVSTSMVKHRAAKAVWR